MPYLNSGAVGQIRSAFTAGRHSYVQASLAGSTLTLPAIIEIAAWIADGSHNDEAGRDLLKSIPHPAIQIARSLLEDHNPTSVVLSTEGACELSTISDLGSADKRWWEYLQRFSSALEGSSYERSYAKALSYTLHEMADNVRQHASSETIPSPASLAGWHVFDGIASFAVIDLGRGVRSSLMTNAKWATLTSDKDALIAVVREQATRKAENQFGDGYKLVVQNFVSRNGCLSLRSGNVELVASGTVFDGTVRTTPCPLFGGTRIAAWCAPKTTFLPSEPVLK